MDVVAPSKASNEFSTPQIFSPRVKSVRSSSSSSSVASSFARNWFRFQLPIWKGLKGRMELSFPFLPFFAACCACRGKKWGKIDDDDLSGGGEIESLSPLNDLAARTVDTEQIDTNYNRQKYNA